MRGLVEKPYLITILLLIVLSFLILKSISTPLLSGVKGCMAAIGYCHCACYCPDAVDCACNYYDTGWYWYCWSACVNENGFCCCDPPDCDLRSCPRAK